MHRVFLDANVFFAAVKSDTGGSYFIIELAKKRLIEVITVAHALAEAERNIKIKIGSRALPRHYENLLATKSKIQSLVGISRTLEEKCAAFVPEKDLPILIGAVVSGAGTLITLDRKHFLESEKLKAVRLPFLIMTPGNFIQKYIRSFAKGV